MSANQYGTYQNETTPLYVTRQEVIQTLSTIANDLSGVNFSNIFANPNPLFSTITMNPTGSILGPAANIVAGSALGISSVLETYNRLFNNLTDPFVLGMRNAGNQYQAQAFGQVYVKPNVFTNETTCLVAPASLSYLTNFSANTPVINWNSGASQVSLSNISSINGGPATGGTTFNSLTGSNITLSGQLFSPQQVGVSSMNGYTYSNVVNGSYSGAFSATIANSNIGLIAQVTLPAGTLQPGKNYLYDVPIIFTSFPPGQPTNFTLNIGTRLGNNGQINYTYPLWVTGTAQPTIMTLTGINQTNSTSVGSQTIDIIGYQQSGSNFSATFNAPVTPANTWTIKLLS
jgi:hypothetical protein